MFSSQNGSTTGQNIHPAVGPMKPARRLEPWNSEKSVAEFVCFYFGEHPFNGIKRYCTLACSAKPNLAMLFRYIYQRPSPSEYPL